MAPPTGFRVLAALSSGKMPGGCRFPVSVCIAASVSAMNTTRAADWQLDLRLERVLPFEPDRALPACTGGSRAAPPEDCAGAWAYLQRLDEHRSHPPLEELNLMAEALWRLLDSDGNRHAMGDPDELPEAIDRLEAYQTFQPDRFDRRA